MLFHWRLRRPFHCYYESSFRFTSRLGNICHSCYALLNWIIKVSLTLCIVTSYVGLSRIIIFKLQFSGQENVLVHYSLCVWCIVQPRYAIPLREKRLKTATPIVDSIDIGSNHSKFCTFMMITVGNPFEHVYLHMFYCPTWKINVSTESIFLDSWRR